MLLLLPGARYLQEHRDLGMYFHTAPCGRAQGPQNRGGFVIKALCQPQQQIRLSQLPWWEPSDSRCCLSQNLFPLQGLVSWMGVHRAEPRGVREQASMREMWLSAGAQPAATLSQLGGRAGCVRAGALPSVGSPARERETLQHGTALDNSREGVAWGGLRENAFPSPVFQKAELERRGDGRSGLLLLLLFDCCLCFLLSSLSSLKSC